MSTPETELDLELQLLPAWAKQAPDVKRFENFRGDEGDRPGRGRGGPGFGDRRPRGDGFRDRGGQGPRGERSSPDRRGPREGGRGGRDFDRGRDRRDSHGPREEFAPLPQIDAGIVPEPGGVEALARQIKLTGRAYPVFDIARLVLKAPERYQIRFSVPRTDGPPAQNLFLCELDGTLWLGETAALGHLLKKHFETFYQIEKTPTDPPKGTYTFVAQCGMSGVILGPPNYHDYQKKLVKLHGERFGGLPFDKFKARVKIVRDEEVVKRWVEEQSFKTEYIALNVPEPVRLASREEVERHFRQTHLANLVHPVTSHRVSGKDAIASGEEGLRRLARVVTDEQNRFPLKVVHALCEDFSAHGLQFFKRDKTVTYVSVARPHFLDLERTPVSDGIRRIIEFIEATSGCTRRKLIDALAPMAPPAETPPATSADTAEATSPAPAAAGEKPADAPVPVAQSAVNRDLHWLIHEGHVIEFANGILETAKKPKPRPENEPKARPKKPRQARVGIYLPAFIDAAFTLV